MCDEPFEEAILRSNSGTVFVRGGWGRDVVFLGLGSGRAEDPDLLVSLSRDQAKRVIAALHDLLPERQVFDRCPDCEHLPHESGCCSGAADHDEPENGRRCACMTDVLTKSARSVAVSRGMRAYWERRRARQVRP